MFRWLRLNGEIIGCEVDGIEYTILALMEDEELHELYHQKLQEEYDEKTSKR